MIVDDIEANRAALIANLKGDYDIWEASDGAEALRVLEEVNGIDAILTDIRMPEMDGIELIKRIRGNYDYRHLAIIAVTQYGAQMQEENLLEIGANDFLYKPISPKVVKIRVKNALKNR